MGAMLTLWGLCQPSGDYISPHGALSAFWGLYWPSGRLYRPSRGLCRPLVAVLALWGWGGTNCCSSCTSVSSTSTLEEYLSAAPLPSAATLSTQGLCQRTHQPGHLRPCRCWASERMWRGPKSEGSVWATSLSAVGWCGICRYEPLVP